MDQLRPMELVSWPAKMKVLTSCRISDRFSSPSFAIRISRSRNASRLFESRLSPSCAFQRSSMICKVPVEPSEYQCRSSQANVVCEAVDLLQTAPLQLSIRSQCVQTIQPPLRLLQKIIRIGGDSKTANL